MKYFLATTAISDFWDIDSDLILLGPWCLSGDKNKKIVDGKNYSVVSSPWKPATKIKEASDICHDIYEDLIIELSEQLNFINGVNYPERYWKALIGTWLMQFIEIVYERYIRIENAFSLYPNARTCILPEISCKLPCPDAKDFYYIWSSSDIDNLKLFSIIIRHLYPEKALEKDSVIAPNEEKIDRQVNFAKKILYRLMEIKDVVIKPDIVLSNVSGFSLADILSLELKSYPAIISFKNFDYSMKYSIKSVYSEEQRKRITFKDRGDVFQAFFSKLIPRCIPTCYIESFKKYSEKVRVGDVKAVGSSVGWYGDENFNFFAAEATLKNKRLLGFQHGGGYGMSLVSFPEKVELEKGTFYTWGWNSDATDARALPNPRLSRLADSYKGQGEKILFIGVSMPRYFYMFQTGLLPDDMSNYLDNKKIFLNTLTATIRDAIVYRPYPCDFGWPEKETIQQVLPQVKFLHDGNLIELMKKAALVIIDHPHTAFLEALTINVPSIFYWDHDVYIMRPEAEVYFRLLREAGILYKDPISAAEKVNEIFADPVGWWSKKEVQEARLRFCEHFAYTRKDWLKSWTRELNNIASGR